jgi:hypothetical protein
VGISDSGSSGADRDRQRDSAGRWLRAVLTEQVSGCFQLLDEILRDDPVYIRVWTPLALPGGQADGINDKHNGRSMRTTFVLGVVLVTGHLAGCWEELSYRDGADTDGHLSSESEKESGLTGGFYTCGLTCPGGYHVAWQNDSGSQCPGTGYDRAYCEPNTGSFYNCGLTCPGGWHVAWQNDSGSACLGTGYDRAYCDPNVGSFYNCGLTCPGGWHVAWQNDSGTACVGTGYDRAYCEPNTGSFYNCGLTCPGGWHVAWQNDSGSACMGSGIDRSYCQP